MEKIKKMWPIFLIFFVIIVVIIVMVKVAGGNKDPYSKYENLMIKAAKDYYKDNKDLLPKNNGSEAKISASSLYDGEYLNKKFDECKTAEVVVYKAEEDYVYYSRIDCGENYKTNFLTNQIIKDSLVENVNSFKDGLYKIDSFKKDSRITLGINENGYNLAENPLLSGYVFRGKKPNNYVDIDKMHFRIVQIDAKGDLVLMSERQETTAFDDSYNKDVQNYWGYNDYKLSNIKRVLADAYNDTLEIEPKLAKYSVYRNLCIGVRSQENSYNDGKEECSKVYHEGQRVGLLSPYNYLQASLSNECFATSDPSCNNYNYLNDYQTWTSNPSYGNSYDINYIGTEGVERKAVYTGGKYAAVYYLSGRILYKEGKGTISEPYKIVLS